jgi:hypothetical protein
MGREVQPAGIGRAEAREVRGQHPSVVLQRFHGMRKVTSSASAGSAYFMPEVAALDGRHEGRRRTASSCHRVRTAVNMFALSVTGW